MANKVKYGISKAYYAVMTVAEDGTVTYATPVALPGAVSLSMDAQGDVSKFYADNVVYYQSAANNGYEGDFEIANIPQAFRVDVLGETLGTDNVLVENSGSTIKSFAFLVQFEGDQKATRHVFYNCTVTRPSTTATTVGDGGIEPETDSLTLSAVSLENGNVKAKTTEETSDTIYNAWFTQVYVPSTTPPSEG